jgi:hypothetical protein
MSYSLQQVVVAQLRRIQRLSNINDAIYSLVQIYMKRHLSVHEKQTVKKITRREYIRKIVPSQTI